MKEQKVAYGEGSGASGVPYGAGTFPARTIDVLVAFSNARQRLERTAAFYAAMPVPRALAQVRQAGEAYSLAKELLRDVVADPVHGDTVMTYLEGCPVAEELVKLHLITGAAKSCGKSPKDIMSELERNLGAGSSMPVSSQELALAY